jgi:hypothetical protein
MNTSIALDKLDEWFKLAKPGDIAFHFDVHESLYYIYVYTEAVTKPYWNLFHDVETAQEYIDAHFGKKKEPKMYKRCENCKHFKNTPGSFSWCSHKEHAGVLVPTFTTCADHEPKEERTGPFDSLKFYLKDSSTGEIGLKYICEDCGKVMDEPFHWWKVETPKPTKAFGKPGYHWRCENCDKKERR